MDTKFGVRSREKVTAKRKTIITYCFYPRPLHMQTYTHRRAFHVYEPRTHFLLKYQHLSEHDCFYAKCRMCELVILKILRSRRPLFKGIFIYTIVLIVTNVLTYRC